MKTKALYLTAALAMMLGLSSCNLEYFPSDEMNSDLLLQDTKGAEYIMNACYALMKDEVEFLGYSSGNTYCRHYFQMAEFPGDNICLSAHTTDPLYEATAYMMNDGLKNVGTLWMVAYKIIFMTNQVIETLEKKNDPQDNQLLGEAYFTRALMHLQLVTLFAKPYTHDVNGLGIPLRISTSTEETKRNPVGEVYEQIAKDFRKAADLMGNSRGNAGYPCKEAALGLLSRTYLYMEKWDECIAAVDEALNGADPASKLDNDFANYFRNAKDSKETLFCIAHEAIDDRGQSSIGSMFLKDGIGWGEIYPSDPLKYLYERYPSDIRYKDFLVPQYKAGSSDTYVYYPDYQSISPESGSVLLKAKVTDDGAGNLSFKAGGVTIPIEKRKINGDGKADPSGEYFEYHVTIDGHDLLARVAPEMVLRTGFSYPMIFVNKFSYQDGSPMLSSPVVCRWAEVILNRAEAYAHKGNVKALEDVNVIRTRAGIPAEGMFAAGNLHGYVDVSSSDIGSYTALEKIVYDERRMELAFEGHRPYDVYRNKLNMDRRYPGAQFWKIHKWNEEQHIVYPIPNNEWTVSGIEQNPGY